MRPKYNELLYAASRVAPEPMSEKNRPGSGLVKKFYVLSERTALPLQTPQQEMHLFVIGSVHQAATLFVWFPAHGASAVCQSIKTKTAKHCEEHPMWFEEQAQPSSRSAAKKPTLRAAAVQSRSLRFQKHSCGNKKDTVDIPTLVGTVRIDWLQFPVQLTMYWRACPSSKKASAEGSLSRRLPQHGMVLVLRKFRSQLSCREQV